MALCSVICCLQLAADRPLGVTIWPRLSVKAFEVCDVKALCGLSVRFLRTQHTAGDVAAMDSASSSGAVHPYPCLAPSQLSTDADALTQPGPKRCRFRSTEDLMHAIKENGAPIMAPRHTGPMLLACC